MKITKKQLKRIIKEEKRKLLEISNTGGQMALIEHGYGGVVALPLRWLEGHPDDMGAEIVTLEQAEEAGANVYYEGSHANADLGTMHMVVNELYSLLEEGYLSQNAPAVSVFH